MYSQEKVCCLQYFCSSHKIPILVAIKKRVLQSWTHTFVVPVRRPQVSIWRAEQWDKRRRCHWWSLAPGTPHLPDGCEGSKTVIHQAWILWTRQITLVAVESNFAIWNKIAATGDLGEGHLLHMRMGCDLLGLKKVFHRSLLCVR